MLLNAKWWPVKLFFFILPNDNVIAATAAVVAKKTCSLKQNVSGFASFLLFELFFCWELPNKEMIFITRQKCQLRG